MGECYGEKGERKRNVRKDKVRKESENRDRGKRESCGCRRRAW